MIHTHTLLSRIAAVSMRGVFTVVFAAHTVSALGAEADPEMLKTIRDDSADMQERDSAVKMLAKTKEGAMAMIDLATKNNFPDEMRSSAALALAESDDKDILKGAEDVLPLPKMKDGTRILPISKLVDMKGDVAAGREVFRSSKGPNCINCHQLEGLGREIGPPISTIGEKPKEVLYESIIAPSASIQHGYEAWTVKTKDGKVLSGLKVEDTDDKFTMKTIEGELVDIAPEDIKKKTKEKKSLMPEGLINSMTTKDLINLVEYLSEQKVK
jgi:putative heme-binding domain-containing protein